MAAKRELIAGIIGGMGPEATVDLMHRIIRNTPAADDIDHIRCIVDNNPKVPSRIKAIIEGTGENPAPAIQDMARRLEAWGADFLAIPCNTAHYYYNDVRDAVSIPVLHMIELTAEEALRQTPGLTRAGILASPAVRITRQYEAPFARRGVTALYPDSAGEARLFEIIKAVKRGDTGPTVRQGLRAAVASLKEAGAELCVVACTELGVILEDACEVPVVDAAEVLARAVVRLAKEGTE